MIRLLVAFAVGVLSAAETASIAPASAYERPVQVRLTDRVLPQIAFGGGWSTQIFLINLGTSDTEVRLDFFNDAGRLLSVSIVQPAIIDTSFRVTLPVNTSLSIDLADPPESITQQGWALITSPTSRLGGYGIFRQRVLGRPDFEAVVPISSLADRNFTVGFDNRNSFVTAVALANPVDENVEGIVDITFRDQNGVILDRRTITLPANGHTAVPLATISSATQGRYGSAVFQSRGPRLAGLGLRFSPGGAFTSFHTLSLD